MSRAGYTAPSGRTFLLLSGTDQNFPAPPTTVRGRDETGPVATLETRIEISDGWATVEDVIHLIEDCYAKPRRILSVVEDRTPLSIRLTRP